MQWSYLDPPTQRIYRENKALLPQDSWSTIAGEYEVEHILDVRWSKKRTRNGRSFKEYLVKWKNFTADHNSWEPTANLNCGALLYEFDRSQTFRDRLAAAHHCDEDAIADPNAVYQ